MEAFILIFRHQDGQKAASPEQIQIWMKKNMDWIGGNGMPFEDARVVRHNNVVTNGPFGEIKETIGGYIIVKADTIDEAVEFAKGAYFLHQSSLLHLAR